MKMLKLYKVLLMLALLASARPLLFAQSLTSYVADKYIGTLSITIDGVRYEHENIGIDVEKQPDATLTLSIEDFKLMKKGESKPIGNIMLKDVHLSKVEGSFLVNIASSQTISISKGTSFSGVDTSKTDEIIGGNTINPGDNTSSSSDEDDLNHANGNNQEAEGGWGDVEEGDDAGSSGSGSGAQASTPEWYGPTYGTMSFSVSGNVFKEYADLSFDIYIPSLRKSVHVTFRSGNMPTGIAMVKSGVNAKSGGYTLSGILVTPSYKGIVIYRNRK